jgi:hypothetical protein
LALPAENTGNGLKRETPPRKKRGFAFVCVTDFESSGGGDLHREKAHGKVGSIFRDTAKFIAIFG